MKDFLKSVLAVITGLCITLFIWVGGFVVFMAMASAGSEKVVKVKDNSVLKLNLNYEIPEQTHTQSFDFSNYENFNEPVVGLHDLVRTIQKAKEDDRIKGIYYQMEGNSNSMANNEVLRRAFEDFKSSGKFIVSYGTMPSQKDYYMATAGNEIYLNPKGALDFRGFGAQVMFYTGLLKKLDVDVQIVHRGKFKSAIEPFYLDSISPANREQLSLLLTDLYEPFISNIAKSRKQDLSLLKTVCDSALASLPHQAMKYKLVDGLKYEDEIESLLKLKQGLKEDDKNRSISLKDYYLASKEDRADGEQVAVLIMEGTIVDGEGSEGEIGGDRFVKEIRKLRKDEEVKSVVVRVNSPGGSALASELMWRELQLLKNEKPVVVSMGSVAASGGYYVSCLGSKIYAEQSTITGSIGVFGLIPNIKRFLDNKLGITTDEVEITQHGVLALGINPLDAYELKMIEESIDSTYMTFKKRVSDSRKMPIDSVEAVAQGRVWTGQRAIGLNLVDEIGGLDKAVSEARKLAGNEKLAVVEYPVQKDFFEQLAESLDPAQQESRLLQSQLGDQYKHFKLLQSILNMKGIQARMEYNLEIN